MRQKQLTGMYGYLGSFVTLDDLQARYPAPRLSSYAFVAEKIYKYTTTGWKIAYETLPDTYINQWYGVKRLIGQTQP